MSTTIKSLSFADFRVFAGEHNIKLSRINLLVGENCIGKTTCLGGVHALGHLVNFKDLRDNVNYLNLEPIPMGSFDSIVRRDSETFKLGVDLSGGTLDRCLVEFERGKNGVPREKKLELYTAASTNANSKKLSIARKGTENSELWKLNGPNFSFQLDQSYVSFTQFTTWLSNIVRYGNLPFDGDITRFRKLGNLVDQDGLKNFVNFTNFFRHEFRLPESLLSIKTIEPNALKPQVEYQFNPLKTVYEEKKIKELGEMGRELELFESIQSKEIRDSIFEVLVERNGTQHNLSYVGYGVTSLLPFLCSLVTTTASSMFLLQQPEVHVHPRCQAKLIEMMSKSEHTFLIETHSDHVLAWFQILVSEKSLKHTDVSIIYLKAEPDDPSATQVYPIQFDELGNIKDQPPSYRDFYKVETEKLLGILD